MNLFEDTYFTGNFFVDQLLHPRELRYPVENLGNSFKGTREDLCTTTCSELQKKVIFKN